MLNEEQVAHVYKIINDPAHGREFYTHQMFGELIGKVNEIYNELGLNYGTDREKIDKINNYIIKNVNIRREYFDTFDERIPEFPEDEAIYRTAYAALVKGETMCAGYAEAARILLELAGLETQTLLSKLPGKNKQLLHYVTAIKYDCGSGRDYYIMDPERQKSCEKKGYDFRQYLLNMTFIKPNEDFFNDKIGKNGVGPKADDYIQNSKPMTVVGKNKVDLLFKNTVMERE